MMTTVMMMMTSAKSISPWMAPVTALMTAATMSMMTIGSAICSKKRIHSGVFSSSLSLLGPLAASLLAASAAERPQEASLPWAETTSAHDCRYSCNLPSWISGMRQIDARS